MGDHEGTLKIDFDDFSMKTNLILKCFGGTFGTLKIDEKSFLNTLLGFTPYWDCKPADAIHADSPGVYTSDKIVNLKIINKIQSKTDDIDGSIVNGIQEPIILVVF